MRRLLNRSVNFAIYARRHLHIVDPAAALWHGLRGTFAAVDTFCLFLGYPRSGHTLVMALLDAHPEILLANEVNLFGHLSFVPSRQFVYWLLLKNSRDWVRKGATWQGYSYQVPGQWQGRFERLRVIGNKDAGVTTRSLRNDLQVIEDLQQVVGVGLKILHVVRNPYDNISTMNRHGSRHVLIDTVQHYLRDCAANQRFITELEAKCPVYTVHHEAIIAQPQAELRALCDYVGVVPPEDYVTACASIVYQSPHKSRYKVEWDDESRARIEAAIEQYPFLAGYTFDS